MRLTAVGSSLTQPSPLPNHPSCTHGLGAHGSALLFEALQGDSGFHTRCCLGAAGVTPDTRILAMGTSTYAEP